MKILKAGILPEKHGEFRGRCNLCGCEVSATQEEVKSGYSGMNAQHGHYVLCPTEGCDRQIDMRKVVYRSA